MIWPPFVALPQSIRGKLLLSFSLLVASIALFVSTFFPLRMERQARRERLETAASVGEVIAYSLSAAVYFGDGVSVGEILDGAMRSDDISYLIARDASGRVIVSRGAVPAGGPATTSDVYVVTTPIRHGQGPIGTLVYGADMTELKEDVAVARRMGILVGALILGIGFVVVYAISNLVTRSLTGVSQTVRYIAAGDLTLRAVEPREAEVRDLVRAFNHMVDTLARAQAELAGVNRELERRVDARTSELRFAMAEQEKSQALLAQSESQSRANAEMLQTLIDVAPQAIVGVDLEWRVLHWNRAAEALFGWRASDVLGRVIPYIPEESRAEFAETQARVIQENVRKPIEVVRMRKDGTRVNVLVSASVLRNRDLEPVGYIGVLTDLTERHSLEEQLRQSQKMEAIGRLAGGIAHDFNNILTVITACASLLRDTEGLDEGIRADVDEISTATMRAAALTRQLLTFSRSQVVNLRSVSVGSVVGGMQPMLRRLMRENIDLRVHCADASSPVRADPTQLEQVIMNLVVNAADAMPGGGTLTIETSDVVLDETTAREHAKMSAGDYVLLQVKDTGTGMDKATMDRIFEPFFTTKGIGHGTGLGLATTYAIIQRLHGHIEVKSAPGQGTSFTIYLPHSEAGEDDADDAGPHRSDGLRGGETILLVEDEAPVRAALRRTLQRFGYKVLEADSGESGLAVVEQHAGGGAISVVVTDVMMPGMGGRDFADNLTAKWPELRVIFMSGYADEASRDRGFVDATHTFLQKPFTGAQLARAIRKMAGETKVTA